MGGGIGRSPSRGPLPPAAVPFVALITPVTAVSLGEKQDAGQVLRTLVAELDRRIDAGGRAKGGIEHAAVLAVDDHRLSVERALDVPALVVAVVEPLESHVAG